MADLLDWTRRYRGDEAMSGLDDAVAEANKSAPWTVDSSGVVRTPMSHLIPRARKAFVRLVGEDGLAAIIREHTANAVRKPSDA